MGVCGDFFVKYLSFPRRGYISVERGRGWWACMDWVLVDCILLGVTLVGILLSSGFFCVVRLINPVGGAVCLSIPWISAFLISAAWRDGFCLSLIFQ